MELLWIGPEQELSPGLPALFLGHLFLELHYQIVATLFILNKANFKLSSSVTLTILEGSGANG